MSTVSEHLKSSYLVPGPVTQNWTHGLPMMQQSVLLTAVRGPDALPKYHPSKYLLRWYRRCILLSAMDHRVLHDPMEPNGGSFTGPSVVWAEDWKIWDRNLRGSGFRASGQLRNGSTHAPEGAMPRGAWTEAMDDWVTAYIASLDEVPHHYQLHFLHAAEIVGYKHPDELIRSWWAAVYSRLCRDMHLYPETEYDLDRRLGDDREQWLAYGDEATEA